MSGFKAKMHHIRFPLGKLTALPRPLAVLNGPILIRRERGKGGERKEEGKER